MNYELALMVILTLCVIANAGVVVVLIMLVRKWKRLIKIVEEKVLNK